MRPLHWALILIAIILPVSIICRNLVNTRFSVMKDEVRINNAVDTATMDAVEQIIATHGFIASSFDYDSEFNDVIDVTPALAQESINTFFHTLAVNFNIPYKSSDTVSYTDDQMNSYIKSYFASYVPAVVVIAYDGFYIYSQEQDASGYYGYKLSSKIPYSHAVTEEYSIGYTLSNDLYLFLNPQNSSEEGKMYSGRLKYNTLAEIEDDYNNNFSDMTADEIQLISNDMSAIVYALIKEGKLREKNNLLQPDSTIDNFLQDYQQDGNNNYTVGPFHENRRKVIIQLISDCLTQEINDHNNYANIVGNSYRFALPEISESDWINSIDDISVLAFIQGIPLGSAEGTFYNSFALGGSRIVKNKFLYLDNNNQVTMINPSLKGLYHKNPNCLNMDGEYEYIAITKEDAFQQGYVACQECN